jgi:SAM-dependent methyltransferase
MGVLEEYLVQDKWRNTETMIGHLPIESGQTVLDLGCGPGLVSARLGLLCERVIGIDQNAAFLEAARDHCPSNCEFVEADLVDLNVSDLSPVDGVWSRFAPAYFPNFAPVLERWAACVRPGGWLALIEIDDLLTGHHPLPSNTENAFVKFMDHARSNGHMDFCMGRHLSEICQTVGLSVVSEHSWKDRELAFDGAATREIQIAWRQRFERMTMMRTYFGDEKFNQITETFLKTISSPEHYSTAMVVMVLARRHK